MNEKKTIADLSLEELSSIFKELLDSANKISSYENGCAREALIKICGDELTKRKNEE